MISIIFSLLSALPLFTYADNGTDFHKIGAAICDQINKGNEAYQNDNLDNAHLFIVLAYFKGYDTYMEPPLRKIADGSHIFAVEQQFRDLSTKMTPNPSPEHKKEINDAAQTLCNAVMGDVQSLTAQS